jgi:hypothetical protein
VTTKNLETLVADASARAFIWFYVGTLFGALFGLFSGALLAIGQFQWSATILAGILAAGTITAFYAWPRAAIIGAIFGIAMGGIYVIVAPNVPLAAMILAGGIVAAVIGGLVALISDPNYTALPKILTGCGAGLAAAALAALVSWLLGDFHVTAISALTTLLAAAVYHLLVESVVRRVGPVIPSTLGAVLVAGGWGATMSLGTWVFGGSVQGALDPRWMASVLYSALGGALSGILVGFAFAILGARWLQT